MKRLIPAIICFFLVLGCIAFLFFQGREKPEEIERTTVYLASEGKDIPIYAKNDNKELYYYKSIVRGNSVTSRNRIVEIENSTDTYAEIEIGESDSEGKPIVYYVNTAAISTDPADVVLEATKYVRTPVTMYVNDSDAEISGFAKKGAAVTVTGYSGLDLSDGSVEMYKVTCNGEEGFVYSKYLVDSQSEANAVYNPIYEKHVGRAYSFELYGGSPETLDYYPVEKPELSTGPVLRDARTMYLCAGAMNPEYVESYIDLAVESGVNAMVVDIKDGQLAYASPVSSKYSPTAFNNSYLSVEEYMSGIQKIKDAGIYVIGRIVVFNDENYAADHPEECISSDASEALWPSAYSRKCWEYNVSLGIEAVHLFGFNEIQFDYVRFPESAYSMSESENTDFKNKYNEEKAEAIQNFCFYASDMMHENGAYMSIDVFGECVGEYVTAYGQYWPAISNVVDVISGMPYTDHFGTEVDTWSDPYTTVSVWAEAAAERQKEIETPAIARTWITGYDTPNWSPTVVYGINSLTAQASALYDAGLTGGFIPWHGASDWYKYESYAGVWSNQY